MDPIDRFLRRVEARGSGCWEWTAAKLPAGYGKLTVGGVWWLAHRWSYTLFVGEIPDGLTIDHLCRNTRCVNPTHLEPVTQAVNLFRNPNWTGHRLVCPLGHEREPGRKCRPCDALLHHDRYWRRKAVGATA